MAWPCFWVEDTGNVELGLRRFTWSDTDNDRPPGRPGHGPRPPCANGKTHHDASVRLDRAPARRNDEGYLQAIPAEEYSGDQRWPATCANCAYEFVDEDVWQVNQLPLYRRPDTGEEWIDRVLPIGAMFDAFWHRHWGIGPDGIALTVVLPPGSPGDDSRARWWHIDGPARGDGGTKPNAWTRTCDPKAVPPTVDVNPSILTSDYHGFLRHGVLTDPV